MRDTAPPPYWDYVDLALAAMLLAPALLISSVIALVVKKLTPHGDQIATFVNMFVFYVLWFASLYALLKSRYNRPFWESLGWVYPGARAMLAALTGPLLAIGIQFLGQALHTPQVEMPIKKLLEGRASLALFGVFGVILGPITEELAFRGFLMPLLIRSTGPFVGIILAAVPFAVVHGPEYGWMWQYIVLVATAGVVFGFVRYRTGSTMASALLHATYNLTLFAAVVIKGVDSL
jgi:membrane protease YdiL (CAAX protease family)